MRVEIKRAYDTPGRDGYRVLVDRVWPRGLSKSKLKVDEWMKEIAPSTALRKWFGHDPSRWAQFKRRYGRELATAEQRQRLQRLRTIARRQKLTLVYGAKDELYNQAVALRQRLRQSGT